MIPPSIYIHIATILPIDSKFITKIWYNITRLCVIRQINVLSIYLSILTPLEHYPILATKHQQNFLLHFLWEKIDLSKNKEVQIFILTQDVQVPCGCDSYAISALRFMSFSVNEVVLNFLPTTLKKIIKQGS